jgi:hypothetical protein
VKCAPSRACILTGRNSWQLEEAANHWCYFPARFRSVCEALAENGYKVGHTLKVWGPGVAKGADGQPRSLTGKAYNERKTAPPADDISDLEPAQVDPRKAGMQAITGTSLTDIFSSKEAGIVNRKRDSVLVGKERHDVGRPHDAGYPIRGIVRDEYLYLRNFEISRWPAGNPETGYLNCDGSPTKTECLKVRHRAETRRYWELSFGKRPAEELYRVSRDPDCLQNLADKAGVSAVSRLRWVKGNRRP